MVQVVKKDGSKQDWDKQKLANSLVSAGVSSEEAMRIADEIEQWVTGQGAESLASSEIRAKVSEKLSVTDPDAAQKYSTWSK